MNKTCTKCGAEKPVEEFHRDRGTKDGFFVWCKLCRKTHDAKQYRTDENRRAYIQRRRKQHKAILRAIIVEYLENHPCVDCGEDDIVVLEFDHVRGAKTADVSNMVRSGVSEATLVNEIAKCDVRCANDHRRVTAQRGAWWA